MSHKICKYCNQEVVGDEHYCPVKNETFYLDAYAEGNFLLDAISSVGDIVDVVSDLGDLFD